MSNHPYFRLPDPDPNQPKISIAFKFGHWMLIQAALLKSVYAEMGYQNVSHGEALEERYQSSGGREDARRVNNKIQECLDVIRDCIEAEQPFLVHFE